jgi:hypothetical protein
MVRRRWFDVDGSTSMVRRVDVRAGVRAGVSGFVYTTATSAMPDTSTHASTS